MVAIIISILGSIISGMVLTKQEAKEKEREKRKAKENILILKSIDAIGKLTYANAIAIRDGRTNGELKEALSEYHEVREDLYEYLLEQNSKK